MFKVKEGLKLFNNQTTVRYPTGNYGSFEIDGGAKGSWEGFSIGGRAVFMHDNGTAMGLYNDVNNQWGLLSYFNGETRLYYAGNEKLATKSDGVQVQGLLKFNSGATTTSQSYGIEWTGFDKEGTTDYSDSAYIKHVTNTAGLGGSVLEISSMNDANDGINLKVNSSTAGARVNGNPIFHDAYHPNADKWTTARTHTVTLTGDVTGSASQSVDGTGNKTWTISTTVANDSHSHSNYVVANTTSNANIDSDWGQSFKTFDPIPSGTPPLSSPNIRTINVGENYARRTQIAFNYNTDQAWFRRRHNSTWHSWREFVHSGNIGSQSVNYANSAGSAGNSDTVDGYHASELVNDRTRTLSVGGDPDTFYPVRFSHTTKENTIEIRKHVHNYQTWDGRLSCRIKSWNSTWGGDQGYVYIEHLDWTTRNFVAHVHQSSGPNSYVIVYLRGARTYSVTSQPDDNAGTVLLTTTDLGGSNGTVSPRTTVDPSCNQVVYSRPSSLSRFKRLNVYDDIQINDTTIVDSDRNAVGFVDIKGSGSYHEFGNSIGSVSNDGNWNARLNLAGSQHARLDVKSVSDGIITTMYSHTGQGVGKIGTASNHPTVIMSNGSEYARVDTNGLDALALGVNNSANNTGRGLSLYGGVSSGMPTYGIAFAGTATFGNHGGVTSDWATYFTMSDSATRGWIFKRGTTNVASIDGGGDANFNDITGRGKLYFNKNGQTGYHSVIDIDHIENNLWAMVFQSSTVGNDNESGFWIGNNGYPDMRLRRDSGTVRALISSWEESYVSNGFNIKAGDYKVNGTTIIDSSRNITARNATFDNGTGTTVTVKCDDAGEAVLNLHGDSQGTGRLYVGQSASYGGGIEYNGDGTPTGSGSGSDYVTLFRRQNGTTSWTARNKYDGNNWEFRGDVTAAGNVTAYSDITLKDNITEIDNALEKVNSIRGVTYDRIDQDNARHAGVIAQEVEEVLPEVVHTDDNGIKSVAYGNMVGLLIEAIKEQQAQIDELKAQIKEIKGEK